MALNAECPEKYFKGPNVGSGFSAQREPQKGKLIFLIQSAPGRPVGIQYRQDSVLHADKRALEEGLRSRCPWQTNSTLEERMPQMPESDGWPLGH